MTSYLRSIFGYGRYDAKPSSKSSSSRPSIEEKGSLASRSHSRSRSAMPAPNYIYGQPAPPSVTMAQSQPPILTRPSSKRTKSHSSQTARAATPSPLRFATDDQAASYNQRHRSASHEPIYRTASYNNEAERAAHHHHRQAKVSFSSSSRTNSQTSVPLGSSYHSQHSHHSHSGSHHAPSSHRSASGPPMPTLTSTASRSSFESRPPLVRSNHTWNGSYASSSGSSHVSTQPHQYSKHHRSANSVSGPVIVHMHPLLAATRLHNAPIDYDIVYTPSSRTVTDRSARAPVPSHLLSQPATNPATSARLVLRSEKFPWPIVVAPAKSTGSGSSSGGGSRFYVGTQSKSSSNSSSSGGGGGGSSAKPVTNLDVLYAIHTTLMTRVTPEEWASLGHGSRQQRKVTRAYEKRCTKMGGGWDQGVRRVDWLEGKTRLLGVEVEKHGQNAGAGKLIFGKPSS